MNIVLFGASGMVGQGILRECLLAPDVTRVLSVVRKPTGRQDPKLRELVHSDFTNFSPVAEDFRGYDACFYALGVASAGLSESEYSRVTHDFVVAAAETLAKVNPGMTFVFVSGAGSDSTSRTMWARVKGRAEDAVLRAPFAASYVFRPSLIQPKHGATSRTFLYRVVYALLAPVLPLLVKTRPGSATTTERIGRAMLAAARHGAPERILDTAAINALAAT